MSNENKTIEMTREESMQIEHEIQTGVRTTLPNGQDLKEFQENMFAKQREQEAERGKKETYDAESQSVETVTENQKVNVFVAENGAISARPVQETAANQTVDSTAGQSDLPEDFPGRKELIAAGIILLETVAKLDKESLKSVKGIGDRAAELILNYGK